MNEFIKINHTKELTNVLNSNIKALSDQLNEYYEEDMSKERQIEVLRDSNLLLRGQICELQKDLVDFKELVEIKNLGEQLHSVKENEFERCKATIYDLHDENKRLKEKLKEINDKNKEVGNQMDQNPLVNSDFEEMHDKMKQLLTLTQETAQQQFNIEHYQELLKAVEHHKESIKELNEKNLELYTVLRDYRDKHKDLEILVGSLSYENSNLLHENEQIKEDIGKKSNENQILSETNAKLMIDIKKHRELCSCNAKGTISLPKVRLSLQLQIQNLRRENQAKEQENEKLKLKLHKFKDEIQKLNKFYASEKERMQNETKELINVVGRQKSQIFQLQADVESKESEILRISDMKNLSMRKFHAIEKSFNELEKKYALLVLQEESYKYKLDELKSQVSQIKSQYTAQEASLLQELQFARHTIREQHGRITNQEDNFKKLNNVKKEIETKCETFLLENQKLRSQLASESQIKASLLNLVDALEKEQQTLKNKICSLSNADQDLTKAIGTLESFKLHNQQLVHKYEKLQMNYSNLCQEHSALVLLREQSLKTLKSSEMIQYESEEKVQALRSKIEELIESINILLKERQSLVQLIDEKHRDVTVLSSQILTSSKRQIIPQDHPTLLHRPFIPNQIQEIDQDVNDDRENSSFNDNFYKMKSILLHLGSSFHENTE